MILKPRWHRDSADSCGCCGMVGVVGWPGLDMSVYGGIVTVRSLSESAAPSRLAVDFGP